MSESSDLTSTNLVDLLRSARRLYGAGRWAEAEAACRHVLARDPSDADALHLLGALALRAGNTGRAYGLIGHAVRRRPSFPEALNNLGVALEALGRPADAAAAYREALRLDPAYDLAYGNLGNALRALGQLDAAADAYATAAARRPADPAPRLALAVVCQERGRLAEAIEHYRQRADLEPDSPAAGSDLLFALLHDPAQTPQSLFDAHRAWAERHERPLLAAHTPHENDRDPARRPLRVGYVSPDFREHTVARFIEPVLAHHDPEQVIAVCYSDVARPDAMTARIRSAVPEWRDTAGISDEQLAALIRQDRIDVLVDLTGHMGGNRLCVFARRPAPVQVAYMGYPHSTGLTSMGWRLTDAASDPPELGGEQLNTERLFRLGGGCAFAYRPTDAPDVSKLPALRNGLVTLGMLNRMAKVTPQCVRLWARVLSAVPNARLLVLAAGGEANAAVRRLFESNGVAPGRLRLAPTGPRRQYLRLADEVDVLLDPFPYAGMTTTCDFLWQGVPTVTLARGASAGRAGASLLSAVGLVQCIAETEGRYVEAAVSLASDLPALAALRSSLREQMAHSPLRDERSLAGRMEAAYRQMWRAWCESDEPSREPVV